MDPAKLESLQCAIEGFITHRPSSSFHTAPYVGGHFHTAESKEVGSLQGEISCHLERSRRRCRRDQHEGGMTQTSSVEGTSTYPSRRRISSQSKDHRQHRHVNLSESSRHAHGSHRASSSPAPHKDHSKHNHDNNNHHSTSERHRRRDRDEEDSDSSGNRAHQRVSRRTRTEDTNAKGFPSTVVASASSSPSSTFLSTTDTVQGWLPATSVATCILPLDAKLVELLYALSPTADDRDGKLRVIDEVRRTLWRTGLDIQIYGSLCTGLVIPASDVDCVMMRSSDAQIAAAMSASLNNALLNVASAATSSLPQRAVRAALTTGIRTAADRMRRHSSFTSVTCIAHAKVPIVKCRHRAENVKVDLSFEKDGCVSSNYLCELFCEPGNELARPLIVLIKAMVNHYGLDDPSVGGLGSFPVSMLVLWYLKHRVPAHYAPELHHSIAVLLVGFLQYYGKEFDFKRQGIDYVQQKTFAKAPANDLFIVNPIRPGTNCARAATLFATRVVPQFQKAAEALSPLLDPKASQDVMEQRLLQFFAKSLPGVRSWRDVARQAARSSHRPQNMWDQATNLYLGGVL